MTQDFKTLFVQTILLSIPRMKFFVKILLLSSGHKSLMNRQNPKWFKITNDQLATEKLVYIFYLKLNQSNALCLCLKHHLL